MAVADNFSENQYQANYVFKMDSFQPLHLRNS